MRAIVLCLLLAIACVSANTLSSLRRDALTAHTNNKLSTQSTSRLTAFKEAKVCVINCAPDDAENKANMAMIESLAKDAAVSEYKSALPDPIAADSAAKLTAAVVEFITTKGCGEVVIAAHGVGDKFAIAQAGKSFVRVKYADFFAKVAAIATVKMVHFASCLCKVGAHAKLGMCINGIINPMVSGTAGWLQLPAMKKIKTAPEVSFYYTNFQPIADKSAATLGKFKYAEVAAQLATISGHAMVNADPVIGHVTIDNGAVAFTKYQAPARAVQSAPAPAPSPAATVEDCPENGSRTNCRVCTVDACVIM